jgi:hypothetical protein
MDREYYLRRRDQERINAEAAITEQARAAHEQLAAWYEQLANEPRDLPDARPLTA